VRMKVAAVLVAVIAVISVVLAADPVRPKISDVFHAQVTIDIQEGRFIRHGGGLYAYDTPKGRARTDYRFEEPHHLTTFHELLRFDLHMIFTIDEQKCYPAKVTGELESPWAWIEEATFAGNSKYNGKTLDIWQYIDQEDNATLRVSVYESDPNTPVYFHSRVVEQNEVFEQSIIFNEFDTKEPEDWVFYIPATCNQTDTDSIVGDVAGVVYFANSQWNCANPACTSRVPDGAAQPGYACAEFTARSLAYGGYIPGLTSSASQSAYSSYKGHNLCSVVGLNTALGELGFKKVAPAAGNVNAAYAVLGNGGEGAWSHACIGVSNAHVDCHNIARENHLASGSFFDGINAIWAP